MKLSGTENAQKVLVAASFKFCKHSIESVPCCDNKYFHWFMGCFITFYVWNNFKLNMHHENGYFYGFFWICSGESATDLSSSAPTNVDRETLLQV